MIQTLKKTGVIGHPIAHSKSPLIHSYWFDSYNINGSYETIDIKAKNLKQDVLNLVNSGYLGFNVTVPHKIAIMDLCDTITPLARNIGAVNTVSIKDGKLHGTNTDAFGFIENIKQSITREHWNWNFTDGAAVILGAGGAANAVVYALIEAGVPNIIITNRTRAKAEALKALSPDKITVIDWDDRNAAFTDANLIVNTTALGMNGKPPLDVDLSAAPDHALVTDIVYAPLYTDILNQAKARDLKTVTGIGMLLHQARPGFELWNGVMPEVTNELEALCLATSSHKT